MFPTCDHMKNRIAFCTNPQRGTSIDTNSRVYGPGPCAHSCRNAARLYVLGDTPIMLDHLGSLVHLFPYLVHIAFPLPISATMSQARTLRLAAASHLPNAWISRPLSLSISFHYKQHSEKINLPYGNSSRNPHVFTKSAQAMRRIWVGSGFDRSVLLPSDFRKFPPPASRNGQDRSLRHPCKFHVTPQKLHTQNNRTPHSSAMLVLQSHQERMYLP